MAAASHSPEAGRMLKAARMRVRLSTREVERLSQKLAEEKKSQDYYISHAWLIDIEKRASTPSIYKLYSLSVIYKCGYDEILAHFGIRLGDIAQEQTWLSLPRTHLLDGCFIEPSVISEIPSEIKSKILLEKTNLVSRMFHQWGGVPVSLLPHFDLRSFIYGYVGMEDLTLFPLIRPGSFVEIDAHQNQVDRGQWSNEFDRPIYFVELRDSYACSWCEVGQGRLFLIPHPQSRRQVREVRFPNDAEIVGRVTAVSMRIAEIPIS